VLKYLVKRDDCRWISATNADNIYGTEVVESVRRVLVDPKPKDMDRWPPDMVLTPLDSRNFPEQGPIISKKASISLPHSFVL
jgi:hypothetical protein